MEFKLLVVDDEPKVTEILSQFFLDRGYRVIQAASGDEAVAALEREAVDLLVLDLNMPGMPGEEVLGQVKKKYPRTRVVVVTGYPDREPKVRALGCDGFFAKPLAMDKLVKTINALLTDKDADEMREVVMGGKVMEASRGEPVAQLLFFEPVITLSHIIDYFFTDHSRAGGVYKVHLASDATQAIGIMLAVHPDIVLVDLLALDRPAEAGKQLLSCEFQPKDYIFYLHPHQKEEEEVLSAMPVKRWEGNPFKEEGLKELAELVRTTALGHGLVRK